jgi:hypothetical protein
MNKKKYEGKKVHAENRTQTPSGLTAILKFPGHPHPQKLVQNNNWCGMVYFLEWEV